MAPTTTFDPPKEPIQSAGEELITQLLQMAAGNPQMLMGLALSGAAREVSQLTGLTRRRQGGTNSAKSSMPNAAGLLAGNRGDVDQIMALQQIMAAGGQPGGPMMGGPMGPGGPMGGLQVPMSPSPLTQLAGQVVPQGPPGMPMPMGMPPGGPMGPQAPMGLPAGIPPWLGGIV